MASLTSPQTPLEAVLSAPSNTAYESPTGFRYTYQRARKGFSFLLKSHPLRGAIATIRKNRENAKCGTRLILVAIATPPCGMTSNLNPLE